MKTLNRTAPAAFAAALFTLGFSGFSQARETYPYADEEVAYVRASGMFVVPEKDEIFDNGYGAMLSLGHMFRGDGEDGLQVELETGWAQFDMREGFPYHLDDGDLRIIPFLLTSRASLGLGGGWSFSAGASIGASRVRIELKDDGAVASASDTVLTWGFGAMISCKMSENSTIDLGYRYLAMQDFETRGVRVLEDMGGHIFQAGIRIGW